jgi:hypothetical protein
MFYKNLKIIWIFWLVSLNPNYLPNFSQWLLSHFSYEIIPPGGIHSWGTTFGTKDLRTLSQWISAFITIYYYLINKF